MLRTHVTFVPEHSDALGPTVFQERRIAPPQGKAQSDSTVRLKGPPLAPPYTTDWTPAATIPVNANIEFTDGGSRWDRKLTCFDPSRGKPSGIDHQRNEYGGTSNDDYNPTTTKPALIAFGCLS